VFRQNYSSEAKSIFMVENNSLTRREATRKNNECVSQQQKERDITRARKAHSVEKCGRNSPNSDLDFFKSRRRRLQSGTQRGSGGSKEERRNGKEKLLDIKQHVWEPLPRRAEKISSTDGWVAGPSINRAEGGAGA